MSLNPDDFKTKNYIHFDHKIGIRNVESYVLNQDKIAAHSFLPFVHYDMHSYKYTGEANLDFKGRPIKEKKRSIMYAGHLDNYIYKYYAMVLNTFYNTWAIEHGIDSCSIAYRDNKKQMSNIDFSAEIINDIYRSEKAYIMVGDFSDFFDTINHKILKKRLMAILGVEYLEKDWFNIFKSITKYGYYEKELLEMSFGTDRQLKSRRNYSYFNSVKEFRTFQKENKVESNKNKFGIPQGTAISAVLANIYVSEFDIAMEKLVRNYNGKYRRYSDDFILILPQEQGSENLNISEFNKIENKVNKLIHANKVKIQESKTNMFEFSNCKITNLRQGSDYLDYLGFVFDGKNAKMRGKSIHKFYGKAYKIIDRAKKRKKKKGLRKLPYRKHIYALYTDMGKNGEGNNNFIFYAQRAQKIFDEKSPKTNNLMNDQIKNRKKKIEARLGIKLHIK